MCQNGCRFGLVDQAYEYSFVSVYNNNNDYSPLAVNLDRDDSGQAQCHQTSREILLAIEQPRRGVKILIPRIFYRTVSGFCTQVNGCGLVGEHDASLPGDETPGLPCGRDDRALPITLAMLRSIRVRI